ncbi:MAG TPA: hypothetical protein VGR12_05175 [Solirubrobacteraceae bacterium]|nr:hypothetical protein [Solirubrobacteraceae bacterium]
MRDHTFRHAGLLTSPHAGHGVLPDPAPVDRMRLVASLERCAAGDREMCAHRASAEALVTDAAALVLLLERERLTAKRRRTAALLDSAWEPAAVDEAARLGADELELQRQIDELRELMASVRRRLSIRLAG